MRPSRMFQTLLAVAFAAAVLPAPALAVDPPPVPQTIRTESFDGAYPPSGSVIDSAAIPASPPPTAWWGRHSTRYSSAPYGLWCAGMTPSGPVPNGVNYPVDTAGLATFNLPQLADYYSSSASFRYTMPTYGAGEYESFKFLWYASSDPNHKDDRSVLPTAAAFPRVSWGLSEPANRVNLSRRGGSIRFQFVDIDGGPVGNGPTVDDIAVTGYKYGPVRSLAATSSGPDVRLTWQRPFSDTALTAEDTRTISYRVWRSPDVPPYAWTELTSGAARASQTSFTDTAPADGRYRYLAQAWDPGTGIGYGELDLSGVTAVVGDPPLTERLAGSTRFDTAVALARAAYPSGLDGSRTVVIANGRAFPDALAGASLAGASDGPLLLVEQGSVPSAVASAIADLGAQRAYVLGGTGAVGSAVETRLAGLGLQVTRLAGTTRYATAQEVAAEVLRLRGGVKGGTVFVATGADFPDALAASSLAAALKAPILFTTRDALPQPTKDALLSLQPTQAVVCGGTAAVGIAAETELASAGLGSIATTRQAGAGRYDTARALADWGAARLGDPEGLYLATGRNFPDALAGGVVAAVAGPRWRPLMLTPPTSLAPQAIAFIGAKPSVNYVGVIGGSGAVSDEVQAAAYQSMLAP